MTRTIIRLELRSVLLRPAGLALLSALALLAAIALHAGNRAAVMQADAAERHAARIAGEWQEWRAELAAIESGAVEPGPFNARPISVKYAATLPPGPLGDFATGLSEIHPDAAIITPRAHVAALFPTYPFENPGILGLGNFDLALLIVIVAPLAMIALCFDALGSDRQSGRLPMVAAQTDDLGAIIWTRLIVRSAAIWLTILGVSVVALLVNGGDVPFAARLARFTAFCGVTAVYAAFWFAVIAVAVAFLRRSTLVAASLLSAWLVVVFAVPAMTSAIRDTAYPLPSRLAFLSEMRMAQSDAAATTRQLTDRYFTDHPELTITDDDAPRWHRDVTVTNLALNERLGPVLDSFAEQRARRTATAEAAQFASPAMVTLSALVAIADAGADRAHGFEAQARAHLVDLTDRLSPVIMSGGRITGAEADSLPQFAFAGPSPAALTARLALPVGSVLVLGLILGVAARKRLAGDLSIR